MKKKILFVSINRHQKKYFKTLNKYLKRDYDVTLIDFSIRHYFDTLLPEISKTPTALTPGVIDKIIRFSSTKGKLRTDFGRLRKLLHAKKQLSNCAKRTFSYFYEYLQKNKIEMVCIWNGNSVERAAIMEAAKALSIKTIYFENGLLPNTTTMDPTGVNYSGIMAQKTSTFLKNIKIIPAKLNDLFQEQLMPRAQKNKWYQNSNSKKQAHLESPDFTKPYLFVPFQVHDDTQIILHSPYLRNMEELTALIAKAVEQYNETSSEKLSIIIKEHPSDIGRINYASLKTTYPEITFLQSYSTETLIEKSVAVITINSSVGTESLLKHKKVITLGNAAYSINGVVKQASNLNELIAALTSLEDAIDDDLINHFLYYVRYIYSIEGSWRKPSEIHLKSVQLRIESIFRETFFLQEENNKSISL